VEEYFVFEWALLEKKGLFELLRLSRIYLYFYDLNKKKNFRREKGKKM
jgi:hypothetical protein